MLIETHSGIFLAALVLIAMVLVVSFVLARKLALRHIPAAVILSGSAIYWLISSLGSCIVIGKSISIYNIELIPFSTVFKTLEDFQGLQSYEDFQKYYLFPHIEILVITFLFGVIWGTTSPVLFNIKSIKKYVLICLCTIIPLELTVNILHLFQISYERYYDTARYLLLTLGAAVGFLIFSAIRKRNKEKTNDYSK